MRCCSRRKSRYVTAAIASLLLVAAAGAKTAASEPAAAPSELMLIFDASGSMWGQVQKEAKITIARRVLKQVMSHMPAESGVGLVAYGHRSKTDCADIETIVPPGSKDRAALLKAVDETQPKGMTPITASVQKVFELLRSRKTASTIVLISDGIETCKGDPCKAVRDAKAAGINFVLHVVGFDMGDNDVSQLECAAQAGGGLYLTAANADELGKALDQAVALTPETPTGKLSIKTTADGKLVDTSVIVSRSDGGEVVATQRTYTGDTTNPRIVPLPDGKYDVLIRAVTIASKPEQKLPAIEIRGGATVEKAIDFSTGIVRVKVTRNGKLSDATVTAQRADTEEVTSHGRTYKSADSNPKELRLPAGTYSVIIGSVEIAGKPTKRWDGIKVGGGTPVELAHEFSSGILRIGAASGGRLVDAVVHVMLPDSKTVEAQGRTYTAATSNPKSFELGPGTYSVTVSPVKPFKAQPTTLDVTIEPGATVEHTVDFPATKTPGS